MFHYVSLFLLQPAFFNKFMTSLLFKTSKVEISLESDSQTSENFWQIKIFPSFV